MAPFILGNHEVKNGEVTAIYINEDGEPTEKLGEAKLFDARGDVDEYVVQKDIEVNVIIVKGEK